jgi:uncharacterized membrane-anchored protein
VSTTAAIVKRQAAAKNYREGYQHALADVLTALEDGGEDAARAWIADNYNAPMPEDTEDVCKCGARRNDTATHPVGGYVSGLPGHAFVAARP